MRGRSMRFCSGSRNSRSRTYGRQYADVSRRVPSARRDMRTNRRSSRARQLCTRVLIERRPCALVTWLWEHRGRARCHLWARSGSAPASDLSQCHSPACRMSERRQIFAGAAVSRDQTHPRLADYGKPLRSAAIPARNIGGSHSEKKIILLGQIRSAFVATALVASVPATAISAETGPLENGFDLARQCESSDAAEKLFCVSFPHRGLYYRNCSRRIGRAASVVPCRLGVWR
jgi:hypothetical protein